MKYRIGVDIGGTSFKAGIVDEQYRIVKRGVIKPAETFERSMKAVSELVERYKENRRK